MKPIYSDDAYASSRLRNSVVMRNNKPFFIKAVGAKGSIIGTPLTGSKLDAEKEEQAVFSFEEGFTLDTVPLGFINSKIGCNYITRIPSRRWRQGLVADAIQGGMFRTTSFFSKNFYNMVVGKYPSYKECVDMVNGVTCGGQAFSRRFAIRLEDGVRQLFYKNRKIGTVSPDGVYELKSQFMYLEKRLRRATHAS